MKASLVIGGSGLLGKALLARLASEDVRAFAASRTRPVPGGIPLDVTDKDSIARAMDRVRPGTVYLAAAFTHVDGCETNPDEGFRVNVMGMRNVLEACRRHAAKLVFFSSDYVFDGRDGPYREDHPPSPLNAYGKQKLEAERLALTAPDAFVLRTCGLYGFDPDSKNFVMQVAANLQAGKTMRVPRDQIGNPTLASDLAMAAFTLSEKARPGLYHVAGPDHLSRFEFARRAAKVLNLPQDLIAGVVTASLDQPAERPLKGGLVSEKAMQLLPFAFFGVEEGLAQFRRDAEAAKAL